EFLKTKEVPWPQLFFAAKGDQGWNNPLARKYGVRAIPSTILVDRAGKVVQVGVRGEALEPAVAKLLGKEPAPPTSAEDGFAGKWVNVNEKTNGLTRIEISRKDKVWTIQAWGAAGGGEIDQGKTTLSLLGDSVADTTMKYGFASWHHGFKDTQRTLQLKEELLIVEDFNIFKDNSGRSNYRSRSEFKRMKRDDEKKGDEFKRAKRGEENKGDELARGQTVILGTWTWDIETNKQGGKKEVDVWWEQVTNKEQFLVPRNGAGLIVLDKKAFDKITREDLRNLKYSNERLANDSLAPGTVVALRTNEGNFAKLKVVKYRELHDFSFSEAKLLRAEWRAFVLKKPNMKNYHLEVEWALYRK
ncbi:MAG TPA: hypothetical protein VH682_13995, partial [Gemmataceae bacterium]